MVPIATAYDSPAANLHLLPPLPALGRAFTAAIEAQGDPDLKGIVMKTSLIIIAAALAVVAGVSAASAASRPTLAPAAKAGCEFATLPRATPAGQQSLYGHISSLRRKGDHYLLRFDPAWLLSGLTASRASLADTGSADVPNDTYTRDETHKVLTFLVRAHAQVTVLTHATCSTRTTVAKFARSATPSRRFWIQVRSDTVRSIDEQYHP